MGAGALSDDSVAMAAKKVVPIYVDCTTQGAHQDLIAKYGVPGYPTMIYVDPSGKAIGQMRSLDASAFVRDFEALAKEFPGKGSLWAGSLASALDLGRKKKRPVAVYLSPPGEDLEKLPKAVGDRRNKAFWVLLPANEETLRQYGVEAGPALVLLDPKLEKPETEPLARIERFEKFEQLAKSFDEALRPKPKPRPAEPT